MYLAIDVGGTKTLLAVFDGKGKLGETFKFKTPPDYKDFVAELGKAVRHLEAKKFNMACAGIPGKVDRSNGTGIAFGNRPWENVPIKADIEKELDFEILIENDANLAGLYEANLLKEEFRKVLYVTVSTGIGGGYIIDGVIDPNFADAEIGHMLLEHEGKLQAWEDFASGRAIKNRFGKLASEIENPSDWYVISRNLAIGLIDLIATMTPEVIVIGGGVGTHLGKFKDRLIEELKIYENPLLKLPEIRQAKNAEEAVIYGCYWLIKQRDK